MPLEYFPLHLHTTFSIGDGIPLANEWAEVLKQRGFKGGGIADHGTLSGIWKFQKELKEKGLKPVLGVEVYVVEGYTKDKERWHLTLFFKNEKGYKSYLKLHKKSYEEGFYYKPRVLLEDILNWQDLDVIVLSGCVYSPLLDKPELIERFLERFGKDFYLELSLEPCELRQKLNPVLVELRKKYPVKFCFTVDAHFIKKEDGFLREIIKTINRNEKFQSKDWNKYICLLEEEDIIFLLKEYYLYLKSYLEEALNNTFEIAEKCGNFELRKYDFKELLPKYGKESFLEMVEKGLRDKNLYDDEKVLERLQLELNTFFNKGYCDYMMIVKDYIDYARSKGILVGPGRGSVGGSLVAYLLDIISFSPLDFDLYFERFISPDRVEPPDIDVDFEDEKRDEVINYLKQKYGEESVVQIITYSYWQEKQAFRDICRIFDFEAKYLSELPEYLQKACQVLVGRIRHRSRHAAGVVIVNGKVYDYIPVEKVSGELTTAFDYYDLEEQGLVKFDILGLSTLSVISKVLELAGKKVSFPFKVLLKHLGKKEIYDVYNKKLLSGIFQFDTVNAYKLLDEFKVEDFNDIVIFNAFNRPGPLSGFLEDLVHYKKTKVYLRQYPWWIMDIVKDTGGIFLFQEQIMELFKRLGFSQVEVEHIRKCISKSKKEELEKYKDVFVERVKEKGYHDAEGLWKDIVEFGKYSFNKAHAVAYSLISFMTALLKCRYPLQFYKVLLEKKYADEEKVGEIIRELNSLGVEVILPSVEKVVEVAEIENDRIYLGVALMKGIGLNQAKRIKKLNSYSSIEEFIMKVKPPVDVFKVLAVGGFFDVFGYPRKFLYENAKEFCRGSLLVLDVISNDWDEKTKLKKQLEVMPFLKYI